MAEGESTREDSTADYQDPPSLEQIDAFLGAGVSS